MSEEEKNNNDNYIALIASMDQMQSFLTDFAVVVASYYKSLVENGTPNDVARDLAMEYQNHILNIGRQ